MISSVLVAKGKQFSLVTENVDPEEHYSCTKKIRCLCDKKIGHDRMYRQSVFCGERAVEVMKKEGEIVSARCEVHAINKVFAMY